MARKNIRKGTSGAGTVPSSEEEGSFKLEILVKPGQSRAYLKKEGSGWVLGVRERAREGLANKAVLKALSDYMGIPVSTIEILRGEGSRIKRVGARTLSLSEGLSRLRRASTSVES
jgi:uncharacterized protein YggU (UPF0235/DUF167 family)